jgi:hypothetical protein
MIAVISDISVSSGGVLRLSKKLMERIGVKSGDRLVIMKDNPGDKVIIQFQRNDNVIFRLEGGKVELS